MRRRFDWTDEKLAYLREHYPTESADDIARFLGCSYPTVSYKAKQLGIQKAPEFHTWNYIGRYVKHGVIKK
jgi:hypothetical protein